MCPLFIKTLLSFPRAISYDGHMETDANTPILYAHLVCEPQHSLDDAAATQELKADRPAWVDLRADHSGTAAWLKNHVGYLQSVITNALLADETRPRCEVIDDGVLLILRGVNMSEGADPEDMVAVRLWVDPHRIITLHRRDVRAIKKLDASYQNQRGPKTSGAFISEIINHLLDVMEPVMGEIEDSVDDLEEAMMEEPKSALRHELSMIRRRALMIKRYISPQREAIAKLKSSNIAWLSATDRMQLQEHYDRLTRYLEHLDAIRERCQIIQDELATILADKLNRNSYVLTLVAAIFLPLGFLTGLLGINVGGMPGVESGDAFWAVCAICGILLLVEYAIFKKLRWL